MLTHGRSFSLSGIQVNDIPLGVGPSLEAATPHLDLYTGEIQDKISAVWLCWYKYIKQPMAHPHELLYGLTLFTLQTGRCPPKDSPVSASSSFPKFRQRQLCKRLTPALMHLIFCGTEHLQLLHSEARAVTEGVCPGFGEPFTTEP